jgi:DNA-binding transcriptional ArsR family regulator
MSGDAMAASLDHDHPVDPERVAHARERLLSADDATRLAGLLSLLSDPVRSRILSALDHVEELCVGDLALVLGTSEDAVSYALRLLRTAGLVSNRKVGRVVYYRLADHFPEPLLAHCLRQLIVLTRAVTGENDPDAPTPSASSEEAQS